MFPPSFAEKSISSKFQPASEFYFLVFQDYRLRLVVKIKFETRADDYVFI